MKEYQQDGNLNEDSLEDLQQPLEVGNLDEDLKMSWNG